MQVWDYSGRRALQVFEQMQAEDIQASEVTYGCLLVACERLGDVDRAFLLYKQACQQGIAPSDECHNILVNVCAATGRCAAECMCVQWQVKTVHQAASPSPCMTDQLMLLSNALHAGCMRRWSL